jgi:hypothetical protein
MAWKSQHMLRIDGGKNFGILDANAATIAIKRLFTNQ